MMTFLLAALPSPTCEAHHWLGPSLRTMSAEAGKTPMKGLLKWTAPAFGADSRTYREAGRRTASVDR